MIPTAILAGLVLGLWIRWWAVPAVAAGWAVIIAVFVEPSSSAGALALGAANALVGVSLAIAARHLVTPRPRRPRADTTSAA